MHFSKEHAITRMNQLGKTKTPFLFVIDYEMNHIRIIPLNDVDSSQILYHFNGVHNQPVKTNCAIKSDLYWESFPCSFDVYKTAFDIVKKGLHDGNSFLTNLTGRTLIKTNYSLQTIFEKSEAKYKLWLKDQFCSLSPEIFVQIKNGKIASYPMKGTIDATVPNAEKVILEDVKEAAEHATIVDLIRNDLSIVASNVKVTRYRFLDRLQTHKNTLLQVSSEIQGDLPTDYNAQIGSILFSLLPAGSICGAPKARTLQLIKEAEKENRGYYTGVAGIFDGENLDSGVLIRSIEVDSFDGNTYFRSGGGITAKSDCQSEYDELIQKVYVPICRNH